MSKKKGKNRASTRKHRKQNSELLQTLVGRNADYDDQDGFQTLAPTPEGQQKLDKIRLRRSKKSGNADKLAPVEARPYEDYNPNTVGSMLNNIIEKIKDGKFGKALVIRDKSKLEALIDAFMNMDQDLPNASKVNTEIRKLIQIGKSFYEYDSKQREFIGNITYDGLVARYRGFGFEEPVGIVPSDSKKTGIKYRTLHNNMDKAYALRIGDPVPDGVKESDKIEAFLTRVYKALGISSEVVIELELSPKIDGVSINGTICGDGVLCDPQTRGDEDESIRVPGMDGLDVADDDKFVEKDFGIQYEVFVTYEDVQRASEYLKMATPYVSPRHAASGIVNRLCSGENDELLQFLSLYPIETEGLDGTYKERMDYLSNFAVVPKNMIDRKIVKGNLKELLDKIEKTFEKYNDKREDLDYAIDGMVITVTDDDYQKTIGREGRTNLYQIALKFDPATAIGEVKGIHLDTGKKGFRTIQVDLKHPVFLDGVKYDHVPVLSAGLFDDMGLRVGSEVKVHRVGDVIPSITVNKHGDGKVLKLPKGCPDCGERMMIKNKKLFCGNSACKGNLAGKLVGFMAGIGLEGYSDAFAETIIQTFDGSNEELEVQLHSIGDLFKLTPGIFKSAGITTKDAREFQNRLIAAVETAPDYILLGNIGIPDLGPARAKLLLKQFNGWDKFCNGMKNGTFVHRCLNALGIATGKKIVNYIYDHKNGDSVKYDLDAIGNHMKNITESFESFLKVGHTGYTPSDKVKEICEEQMFEIVDGKSFDILITGSLGSTTDKMEKARKNNLPIFTEQMFLAQYDPDYEYPEEDDED